MLGSYALLLQSPTNSSRLWDKAVNCKSSSSHTNPLCCPESIKGSYNPLLRPEASSHAVLRIQTWRVALGHSGPFCNPVSSTSWVGAAVQGARLRRVTGMEARRAVCHGTTFYPGAAASLRQPCQLRASCFSISISFGSNRSRLTTHLSPTLRIYDSRQNILPHKKPRSFVFL